MVDFLEAIDILLERYGAGLKELADYEANGKFLRLSIQLKRLRTPQEQNTLLEKLYHETLVALDTLDKGPFLMVYYSRNLLATTNERADHLSESTWRLSEALGNSSALQIMDFTDVIAKELNEMPKDHILRQALMAYKDYQVLEQFLDLVSSVLDILGELDAGKRLSEEQLHNVASFESFKPFLEVSIEESLQQLIEKQQQPFAHKQYLTVDEAAAYLNMPKDTLYGLTSKRLIPFTKPAKRLQFNRADLDEWMANGRKKTVAEIKHAPANRK